MKSATVALLGSALLCVAAYGAVHRAMAARGPAPPSATTSATFGSGPTGGAPSETAPAIDLRKLFEPGGPALRPSSEVLAHMGRRVRMTGFMAEMELAPKGAFYLVPRPVHCDEAGGGTADLPPESVLVIVPSARGKVVPHMKGPLETTGVLEIGNRVDAEGRLAAFRLTLDGPPPSQQKEGQR